MTAPGGRFFVYLFFMPKLFAHFGIGATINKCQENQCPLYLEFFGNVCTIGFGLNRLVSKDKKYVLANQPTVLAGEGSVSVDVGDRCRCIGKGIFLVKCPNIIII